MLTLNSILKVIEIVFLYFTMKLENGSLLDYIHTAYIIKWSRSPTRTFRKGGPSQFTVLVKNSFLINSRVLILNITIVFSYCELKIPKSSNFWSKVLLTNFADISANSVMLVSIKPIIFRIVARKCPNKTILVPLLIFFCFTCFTLINSKVLF